MANFVPFLEWEITDACDLACAHCHKQNRALVRELSDARKLALAQRLAGLGVRSVALSGGEPTLCGALWPIVARLRAGGVDVSLITNGRDDSDAFAARCAEEGLDFVWISLDGTEATHDRVRRRPGAFARALRTAANLAGHGVRFGFMTTLLRPNAGELDAIARRTTAVGADLWHLALGLPNGRDGDLWLGADDLAALRPTLTRLAAEHPRLILGEALAMALQLEDLRSSDRLAPAPAAALMGCPAGRQVLSVAADGRLRGCSCLPDEASAQSLADAEDSSTVAGLLDHQRELAVDRERRLRAGLRQAGFSADGGFCHALALRTAGLTTGALASVPCASGGFSRSLAASAPVAICSALLAGLISCGPSKNESAEKTTPPDSSKPAATVVPPPTEPAVKTDPNAGEPTPTRDATPAGVAPDHSTTNLVAPSAMQPGTAPGPWVMPRCCMSHMLVPDCKCSPPTDPNAKP